MCAGISYGLAILLSTLIIGQTFSMPLVYAQTKIGSSLTNREGITYDDPETEVEKQLLRFAYELTRNRPSFKKLIPIPGMLYKESVYIGKNYPVKADVLALFFPAKYNFDNTEILNQEIDLIEQVLKEKYSSFAVSKYGSEGNIEYADVAQTILDAMYDKRLEFLAEFGVKPAFIPYENMSFYVILFVWTQPQDDLAQAVLDSIIPQTLAIANFIEALRDVIADEVTNYIHTQIYSILEHVLKRILDNLNSLKQISCSCEKETLCESSTDNSTSNCKEVTRCEASISVTLDVDNFINALLEKTKIQENEIKDGARKLAEEKFELWLKEHYQEGIPEDQEKYARSFIDLVVSGQYGEAIKTISNFPKEDKELYKDKSTGEDCGLLIKYLEDKINQKNIRDIIEQNLKSFIENLSSEIKDKLQQKANTQKMLGTGLDITVNAIKETFSGFVADAILGLGGPLALTVYAVANGFFAALQNVVTSVTLQFKPSEECLILETEKVKFATDEDIIEVKKSPQFLTNVKSGTKAFLEGLINTGVKVFDSIPVFKSKLIRTTAAAGGRIFAKVLLSAPIKFAIYADLKTNKIQALKAPSYPGIYSLEGGMSFETAIDKVLVFTKVIDNVKNFFTTTIPSNLDNQKVDKALLEGITYAFDQTKESIKTKIMSECKEHGEENIKGFEFSIPYYVLSPYFIVDSIHIYEKTQEVILNMYAIYDLNPLFLANEVIRNHLNELSGLVSFEQKILLDKITTCVSIVTGEVLGYFVQTESIEVETKPITFTKFSSSGIGLEPIRFSFHLSGSKIIVTIYKEITEYGGPGTKFIKISLDSIFKEFMRQFISQSIRTVSNEVLESILDKQSLVITSYLSPLLTLQNNLLCPVLNSENLYIAPYFSAISVVGGTIDRNGFVSVRLKFSDILRPLSEGGYAVSLKTIPVFVLKFPEGGQPVFCAVPGSGISLEPIVMPLIPVVRSIDGMLTVKFTNPFLTNTPAEYSGVSMKAYVLADGKPHEISWDSERGSKVGLQIGMNVITDSAIVTLQIDELHLGRGCLGAAILIPMLAEVPIYINPGRVALMITRATEGRNAD